MKAIFLSNNKIFNCEVIIVGAGIAGISAAKIFEKNNISNIVIEANNRLGGRAKKAQKSFGSWFDLGCSYLHEGDINPLTSIAKRLKIPISYEKGDLFSIEKTKYFSKNKKFSLQKVGLLKNSYNDFLKNLYFYKNKVKDRSLSSCLNRVDPCYPIIFDYLTGLNAAEANFVSTIDFASLYKGSVKVLPDEVLTGTPSTIFILETGVPVNSSASLANLLKAFIFLVFASGTELSTAVFTKPVIGLSYKSPLVEFTSFPPSKGTTSPNVL